MTKEQQRGLLDRLEASAHFLLRDDDNQSPRVAWLGVHERQFIIDLLKRHVEES